MAGLDAAGLALALGEVTLRLTNTIKTHLELMPQNAEVCTLMVEELELIKLSEANFAREVSEPNALKALKSLQNVMERIEPKVQRCTSQAVGGNKLIAFLRARHIATQMQQCYDQLTRRISACLVVYQVIQLSTQNKQLKLQIEQLSASQRVESNVDIVMTKLGVGPKKSVNGAGAAHFGGSAFGSSTGSEDAMAGGFGIPLHDQKYPFSGSVWESKASQLDYDVVVKIQSRNFEKILRSAASTEMQDQVAPWRIKSMSRLSVSDKRKGELYGTVYAGKYEGEEVTVKVLYSCISSSKFQGDFYREMGLLHELKECKRLVRLLGAWYPSGKLDETNQMQSIFQNEEDIGNRGMMIYEKMTCDLQTAMDEKLVANDFVKLQLLADIAEALYVLHENSIPHLNLNPTNIFVKRENGILRAKVSDFGIMELKSDTAVKNSEASDQSRLSRSAFRAPELFRKNLLLKPRSKEVDVWSFGALLCWIMADFSVYDSDIVDGEQSKLSDLADKRTLHTAFEPAIEKLRNGPVGKLGNLAERCLRERNERGITFLEIADEIEACLDILDTDISTEALKTTYGEGMAGMEQK